jgi:integrase
VGFIVGFGGFAALFARLPDSEPHNLEGEDGMNRLMRPITDRELKASLAAGAVDRAVGEGLTFVASPMSARAGKASWILRFRIHGRSREKVLGRYPELSLKDARDQARRDREQIERGVDVAAVKQAEKTMALEVPTVERLGELWFARYIEPRYKHPEVVARVLRRHINPVLGSVSPPDVQPVHVDRVLTRIVAAGAPTVANDALRYMSRMFRMAVRNHWIERNPAADFDLMDAGGEEASRERWLALEELEQLASAMRGTPNFGREHELAVWLLLALCVRKMELLSARWESFDLDAGVWTLDRENTKTRASIRVPLAPPVIAWLKEARVFSFGKPFVFPARRLVRLRLGEPRRNRFEHVGPDTLNVALRRLKVLDIEHFNVHDMRRTARTHLASLGVDRFVAERSLNHKLGNVEGIYDRHDYFAERRAALASWAEVLERVERGESAAEHAKASRAYKRAKQSGARQLNARAPSGTEVAL